MNAASRGLPPSRATSPSGALPFLALASLFVAVSLYASKAYAPEQRALGDRADVAGVRRPAARRRPSWSRPGRGRRRRRPGAAPRRRRRRPSRAGAEAHREHDRGLEAGRGGQLGHLALGAGGARGSPGRRRACRRTPCRRLRRPVRRPGPWRPWRRRRRSRRRAGRGAAAVLRVRAVTVVKSRFRCGVAVAGAWVDRARQPTLDAGRGSVVSGVRPTGAATGVANPGTSLRVPVRSLSTRVFTPSVASSPPDDPRTTVTGAHPSGSPPAGGAPAARRRTRPTAPSGQHRQRGRRRRLRQPAEHVAGDPAEAARAVAQQEFGGGEGQRGREAAVRTPSATPDSPPPRAATTTQTAATAAAPATGHHPGDRRAQPLRPGRRDPGAGGQGERQARGDRRGDGGDRARAPRSRRTPGPARPSGRAAPGRG